MISRKITILFLAIILLISSVFLVHASLLAPFISKLAPAAASASATGSVTIPAKVLAGTSTAANVASWVSLVVPGGAVAKITVAGLCVAGALAADYLVLKGALWFAETGNNTDGNGNFTKTKTTGIPNGYTPENFLPPTGNPPSGTPLGDMYAPNKVSVFKGFYATQAEATQFANADCAVHCEGYPKGIVGQPGYQTCSKSCSLVTGSWSGTTSKIKHVAYSANITGEPNNMFIYFFPNPGTPSTPATFTQPQSKAALEAALAASLAAGSPSAAALGKEGLVVAAAALDDPAHPVSKDSVAKGTIDAALVGSLTQAQKDNLEAAATPNVGDNVLPDVDADKAERLTPAQIAAAVQAALAGQGLSASQIAAAIAAAQAAAGGLSSAETTAAVSASLQGQGLTSAQIAAAIAAANPALTQAAVQTAVKSALDDDTGVPPVVDPTIVIPEKLSLTTVMQNFVNSINALPIFATLNGITINVSGSSTLCINLPSNLGGTKCWDGANMQNGLNMIGSAFLGLTSIISFIGIFKG